MTRAARQSDSDPIDLIQRLTEIGIALSSEHDLDSLLRKIVGEGRSFTSADAGSLYLVEGDSLVFKVAQNDTLKRQGKPQGAFEFRLPLSRKSIAGYVALTGRPLNIEDVYAIPPEAEYTWYPESDKQSGYKTVSMLAVPMTDHRRETIGVLQLINSLDSSGRIVPFGKEYERLITSLASQAAVAVDNAMLIDETKKLLDAFVRYSASAIDARSPYTAGHTRRVAELSLRIARAINNDQSGDFAGTRFTQEEIQELGYAAWLHDIGKIGVREHVLDKAARLFVGPRIDTVTNRFDSIKNDIRSRYAEKKLDALRQGRAEEELSQLDRKMEAELAQVEEELEFILQVNKANWISDEQRDRIVEISKKSFVDSYGHPRRCLYPDEVRHLSVNRGNLTSEEFLEVQSHVQKTARIVEKIPFTKELRNVPLYAATHHERLSGRGYPKGLRSEDIPLQGRIMAVADVLEALIAKDRPYKDPIPLDKALLILKEEAESGNLDPRIVDLVISRKLHEGLE